MILCCVCLSPAAADPQTKTAPTPLPPKEQQTLETFGDAHPACGQWSDGCAVCQRRDDGSFGCSLPGIACEPSSLTCRQTAQKPKPAGESAPPKSESIPK